MHCQLVFVVFQSRAADAMLMLQGSSSDGGEDGGGSGSGGNALSNTSRTGGDSSSLMSSHSQGKSYFIKQISHVNTNKIRFPSAIVDTVYKIRACGNGSLKL
ncbi:hypothetical protein Avbf_07933 [Armadillidium vulgare]|nr:hypothetical protein Avbf_07933 [Armadillidium vulgare]